MDLKLNMDFSKKKTGPFDYSKKYDLIVIGLGPAGLNAALYAKRKGLEVALIGNKSGGQVIDTTSVENYLGTEFKTGEELVKGFTDHVMSLKVPLLKEVQVTEIKALTKGFTITLNDGNIIEALSVIVATGSRPRKLGVTGEDSFLGKGVAYCAICDGPLFEGLDVIVAGGGNSAVEAAIDLSKIANKVTLVHRSQFRADQIVIDKLNTLSNVEIFLETEILEVKGQALMSGVVVKDKATGETRDIEANGLFVEIGYLPNSGFVKDFLKLNAREEIIVNALNETSVPGVFAAGDVTDVSYKQIVISAGEGAKAALTANDYINRLK